MTTQLDLVNRILRRIREDTVDASSDSNAATIVAEMVADAYAEVLDAHMWEALKHITSVTINAGQTLYDLSRYEAQSGDVADTDERIPTIESELQWMDGNCPEIYLYDDSASLTAQPVQYITPEAMRRVKSADPDQTNTYPIYVTIRPLVSNATTERLWAEVYPEPTAASFMQVVFWTTPPALEADGTTDDTRILVPPRPVYQLALMHTINERGEELGEPGNLSERRYQNALGVAIERDISSAQRGDRYDWHRD